MNCEYYTKYYKIIQVLSGARYLPIEDYNRDFLIYRNKILKSKMVDNRYTPIPECEV